MPNRLIDSKSTYLLQHADNPIDWWPWCDEAFEQARETNRLVLLSIGYASCHWCHVMAHESFEDSKVAEYVNENFVAIKVDRQEYPEVDAAFMRVTQAISGAGGWPMTLFLTPEGLPFFAGTYFPPESGPGAPSFIKVCEAMADAWSTRQDEVVASAGVIAAQLGDQPVTESGRIDIWKLMEQVSQDFDPIHGGWGQAPKFPSANLLEALLVKGDRQSLDMAQRTLEAMARGAIADQLGGGFHRYTVDQAWAVPHFEKMLYDNALLLGAYVRGWRRTADHDGGLRALLERTAYGIVEFLVRELRTGDGAFMAGLDADSCDIRGSVHEGIFYLWNHDLLVDALGEEDANWASHTFHVTRTGTFDDGLSTLQLRGSLDHAKLDEVRVRLLKERESRFRPATDEQVVASWNAWLIESLLSAAMIFNEADWIDLAESCAEYLWQVHFSNGQLFRTSMQGRVGIQGGAEDYGSVASAFAVLAGVKGEPIWLDRAQKLIDLALELFSAPDGGFNDSVTVLGIGQRSLSEGSTPSGTSCLIAGLRRVGLLAERQDLIDRADAATLTTRAAIVDNPRSMGGALADLLIDDDARRGLRPAVVVVVTDDPMDELVRAAWRLAPAGTMILAVRAGTTGFGTHLEGRVEAGAYICRGRTCFDRVNDYSELKDPLWQRV